MSEFSTIKWRRIFKRPKMWQPKDYDENDLMYPPGYEPFLSPETFLTIFLPVFTFFIFLGLGKFIQINLKKVFCRVYRVLPIPKGM